MNEREAYAMMIQFLENYQSRGPSDEVAGLLGAMQMDEDGLPFDAAFADDWNEAVNQVRQRGLAQVGAEPLRKAS